MKTTCSPKCEECGKEASYAEWVPDACVPGNHPSEAGYRLKPLCWPHKLERLEVATARFEELLVCGDVARIDRGRWGGDVACEACGRKLYDHRANAEHPYMTELCDGSVVKL